MRPPKLILPTLTLTLGLLLHSQSPGASRINVRRHTSPQGTSTVIFSVKKYNAESSVQMEPIVIINGDKYTPPPLDDEAGAKKFTDNYFRAGRRYRVLFGGGEAGSLTVVKNIEPGCVGLLAEVTAQTTARVGGQVQALAVTSEKIGRGESSRRAPTEAERAAALEKV